MRGYFKTLEMLAQPDRRISDADRAQLRAIRQACDSSGASAHSAARTFRNTLVALAVLVTAVLAGVAGLAWADQSFRAVFTAAAGAAGVGGAAGRHGPSGWYVLELEVVASLPGLASAALALKNYTGHRHSYGLPLIQTLLKGSAGAATGLLGVVLAGSGLIRSLALRPGAQVFTVALLFGGAQYLFTRLIDGQARDVLSSAGSPGQVMVTPPSTARVWPVM